VWPKDPKTIQISGGYVAATLTLGQLCRPEPGVCAKMGYVASEAESQG